MLHNENEEKEINQQPPAGTNVCNRPNNREKQKICNLYSSHFFLNRQFDLKCEIEANLWYQSKFYECILYVETL